MERIRSIICHSLLLGDVILFHGTEFTRMGYKKLVADTVYGKPGCADGAGRADCHHIYCYRIVYRGNDRRVAVRQMGTEEYQGEDIHQCDRTGIDDPFTDPPRIRA